MFESILENIRKDERLWPSIRDDIVEREIAARTPLLREGEISRYAFLIRKGCLRMWFNKDGKDITMQFFFEDQAVASIDSFMNDEPSLFSLDAIEPSTVLAIGKDAFIRIRDAYPEAREEFQKFVFQRFRHYAQLFLSRIKDSPRERYEDLLAHHPEIIRRIPQRYIASYLGITPVSLSRIRHHS
jgi:CRP-like cAMP-binding protein